MASSSRARTALIAFLVIAGIAAVLAFALLRPTAGELEEKVDSPATNFLVRDGKFDCTTLYESAPIGVLQQVPGLVNPRLSPNTTNASTLPGGGTSCSVSFAATGDSADLETTEDSDAVVLRNTLHTLGLPLDYRSFVISTARACGQRPLGAPETLTDPAGQQWELGRASSDDGTTAAELIRLDDDQLGCLTASIFFPEGSVTEVQSATAREFLKDFADAAAAPLAAASSAAKSDQTGPNAAPKPTFTHNSVFDCRAYLFSSSLTQQRELGLISDFSRVPGDFVFADAARAGAQETPLYKIADDGSSVTCWFTSATGVDIDLPTDIDGSLPVSATSTSPQDGVALPRSVPVSQLDAFGGEDANALDKWRYFLYLPGVSNALAPSSSPLELERSRVASINLYRCQDSDEPAADQNCLILSTPLSNDAEGADSTSSLSPDNFTALVSIANRIEPLLSPSD